MTTNNPLRRDLFSINVIFTIIIQHHHSTSTIQSLQVIIFIIIIISTIHQESTSTPLRHHHHHHSSFVIHHRSSSSFIIHHHLNHPLPEGYTSSEPGGTLLHLFPRPMFINGCHLSIIINIICTIFQNIIFVLFKVGMVGRHVEIALNTKTSKASPNFCTSTSVLRYSCIVTDYGHLQCSATLIKGLQLLLSFHLSRRFQYSKYFARIANGTR